MLELIPVWEDEEGGSGDDARRHEELGGMVSDIGQQHAGTCCPVYIVCPDAHDFRIGDSEFGSTIYTA